MKVVVVGASGMLGREIAESFIQEGITVIGLSSKHMDITDRYKVFEVLDAFKHFDILINCAAFTEVDNCQYQDEKAFRVNGDGPRILAEWAALHEVTLVHFSTDYVFDGTKAGPYVEEDTMNPINVYGDSKRIGELGIITQCRKYYIFRIQWLYGDYGHNFIQAILKLAQTQDTLTIVNDQWGSPTWTLEVARCLSEFLQAAPPYGTYHFHNTGYTTWFEFAKLILDTVGLPNSVKPVSSETFLRPAQRPLNGQLDMKKYLALPLTEPLSWQEAATIYIKDVLMKLPKGELV